ncbi:MAG: 16S rRNA (cytosine(1402)-N(4))-methyltransferase RsmH [Candidatus Staskawiczbacteria bacterium]|nr:16S rRNA (cytosine(1402)-N(4))-methyltransferase RsmH [Candidatus Staskawiczbacteria bacterium]
MTHIPVLTKEVLHYLDPKENENFIDCTIGEWGHTILILERNKPLGKVLGIDWDPNQIKNCRLKIKSGRLLLVNDSYCSIKEIIGRVKFGPVNGILLDLGYSSWQLEKSGRGFSFRRDEDLDMRYNTLQFLTAKTIVNEYPSEEIEKILKEYGEEKFARRIAQKISEDRKVGKIESTAQLVSIIKKAVPKEFQQGRIHCATKTFQALRIAVNDELNNLTAVLPKMVSVLSPGGRIVIISFHSLEDRIAKLFFKEKEKEGNIKILTKKPQMPKVDELNKNPRARSAKLRAFIKL